MASGLQGRHDLEHLLCALADALHGLGRLGHLGAARVGLAVGLGRLLRGLLARAGDLADASGHLGHDLADPLQGLGLRAGAGGHALDRGGDLAHGLAGLVGRGRQLAAELRQLARLVARLLHHGLDPGHEAVERPARLGQLVGAGLVHALGQVAVAVGDLGQAVVERAQGADDRTRDGQAHQHAQRQDDQQQRQRDPAGAARGVVRRPGLLRHRGARPGREVVRRLRQRRLDLLALLHHRLHAPGVGPPRGGEHAPVRRLQAPGLGAHAGYVLGRRGVEPQAGEGGQVPVQVGPHPAEVGAVGGVLVDHEAARGRLHADDGRLHGLRVRQRDGVLSDHLPVVGAHRAELGPRQHADHGGQHQHRGEACEQPRSDAQAGEDAHVW